MTGQTLGIITAEGFTCTIVQDEDGRVHFMADADIDADGANGQSGHQPAYKADNSGSEALANGGMKISGGGKVVCAHDWARDVVLLDTDNEPKIFPGGVIASMTWYRHRDKLASDPAAYVDAETVPYIVVPPLIVQKTSGVVRGCKAQVTWHGKTVACVVADRGPAQRIGELSIAAARALGMPSSPRNGGTERAEVLYELWPGTAAPGFELQPA
ncbi:glycoside hydrolase family 75 protein [Variovorax humicola]|uniref:Glycoside hydrolase family 75 protein n=1 Tax=Variovorax humicola TaxID=1769758 RepID=A0ABU8W174_9BURK